MNVRTWLLCGCTALATCGEAPVARDPAGRFRVVAAVPVGAPIERAREALAARVAAHGAPSMLFADNQASAAVAMATEVPTVAIMRAPDDPATGPRTTFVVDETGAAVAVDMALLACAGIEPPARLPIGTHVLTPANRAAGGTTRSAAGDLVVELLRRQHAAVLDPAAPGDVVFKMGVLIFAGEDPWHARVRDELVAAARRFRRIEVVVRDAGGSPARQGEDARALLADGHRAIFVTTDDPESLGSIAQEARDRKVALIVLDRELRGSHATCCIGADQNLLGRAAGEAVASLLPEGGTIVELRSEPRSRFLEQRAQGFRDALELR